LSRPEAPHRLQFNWNSGAGHCSRARIRAEPIIMNVELAEPKLPLCPSCAQNMRLIRRMTKESLPLNWFLIGQEIPVREMVELATMNWPAA
jgi:hypothetical protein